MARIPKRWFDDERDCWKVTTSGKRLNIGQNEEAAFQEFYRLMNRPMKCRKADSRSLPAVIDAFLDWTQKHRAPDTFEWYRYRLQRFADQHPALTLVELKPFHVERWVDGYGPHISCLGARQKTHLPAIVLSVACSS